MNRARAALAETASKAGTMQPGIVAQHIEQERRGIVHAGRERFPLTRMLFVTAIAIVSPVVQPH